MAEGHGGMRRPSNPAPVSGPGSLSRRTDGQGARYMAGGEYGEGQEMMDLQTSAPMSQAPSAPRPSRGGGRGAGQVMEEGPRPTPLFAPTERPDEPITAGAPFGPGPGPAQQLSLADESGQEAQMMRRYLPALESIANSPQGTPTFRRFVRFLRAASE
jgi:hypothetical protein